MASIISDNEVTINSRYWRSDMLTVHDYRHNRIIKKQRMITTRGIGSKYAKFNFENLEGEYKNEEFYIGISKCGNLVTKEDDYTSGTDYLLNKGKRVKRSKSMSLNYFREFNNIFNN